MTSPTAPQDLLELRKTLQLRAVAWTVRRSLRWMGAVLRELRGATAPRGRRRKR